MESNGHTLLRAVKLWLIWNLLADSSLVISLVFFAMVLVLISCSTDYFIFLGNYAPQIVFLLILVLGSLFAGLIQWLAFIDRIKQSYAWIIATTLGYSLTGIWLYLWFELLPVEFPSPVEIGIATLAGAFGGGVIIGLLQWLVLRGKVSGAGWWLLGSILGWVCTGLVYTGLSIFVFSQTSNTGMLGELERLVLLLYVLGLFPMSMITGIAYAYLFTQPSQRAPVTWNSNIAQ